MKNIIALLAAVLFVGCLVPDEVEVETKVETNTVKPKGNPNYCGDVYCPVNKYYCCDPLNGKCVLKGMVCGL